MPKKKKKTWVWVLALIIIISIAGFFIGDTDLGNVALIKVEGVIVTNGDSFLGSTVQSSEVVSFIEEANKNRGIDAILLEINSPGGSAVASLAIVEAIEHSQKPVVAYVRDSGASGGYWVGSAADKLYASPLSIVGSVGVTAAHLEFTGLIERYNVTYRKLTAGEFKDIGSPFRSMSEEEMERLQEKLDVMHQYFLDSVQENRNFDDTTMEELSKADFYVGLQAKELGLIDDFGGKVEALTFLEQEHGIKVSIVEYEREPSFAELFSKLTAKPNFDTSIELR